MVERWLVPLIPFPSYKLCASDRSSPSYYRWKAKFGGLELSEAKRLRQLKDENRKLKQLVGDLSLDKQALQDVLSKNF